MQFNCSVAIGEMNMFLLNSEAKSAPVWFGENHVVSPIRSNRQPSLDLVKFECKSWCVLDDGVDILRGGKSGVSTESLQDDVPQSTVTVDG